MSLALCLQVVSHAPQHFRTSEVQATCDGCFPASLSPGSGMFRAVHPQSFQRWMPNNEICQSGLPIPLFGASSMNLWGWWHEWSDCYLLRQSSGGNEWQLPPPLSGWWLRLCRLPYRYYGWWLHLAWRWSPTLSGLWWLSHQCTLWDPVVFLNEKLDLWIHFACWLNNAFPSFLAGLSCRGVRISACTFPTPWFAWSLAVSWYISSTDSSACPKSKTCPVPVCIPLCRLWLHGVMWFFDLFHFVSFALVGGLAWTAWSQWVNRSVGTAGSGCEWTGFWLLNVSLGTKQASGYSRQWLWIKRSLGTAGSGCD